MELGNSWKANMSSASQETPYFMKTKNSFPHSQVPNTCSYPEPDISVHKPTPHFLLIYFNITFPSTPWFSKCYHFLRSSHSNPLRISSTLRATWFIHLMLLDLTTRIIFGVECRSLISSWCIRLYSLVTLSLLDLNILLNTLFSNTLSLLSSLSVTNQVSYPFKTTWKFTVIYTLIFILYFLITSRNCKSAMRKIPESDGPIGTLA